MTAAEIKRRPIGSRIQVTEIRRDTHGTETRGVSLEHVLGVHDSKLVLFRLPFRSAYLPIRDYRNYIFEEVTS